MHKKTAYSAIIDYIS